MKPEVSIIVPVYNCGNSVALENLVSSVLNQTVDSWELLLCNDGSVDNTLAICQRLAQKDNRIKVFDCKHQGVSATRNIGIANALGNWISFVDADDIITGIFIESMLNKVNKSTMPDLICCSYMVMDNQKTLINLYSDSIYAGESKISSLLSETKFLKRCSPWARMFRASIIRDHNLSFDINLSHSEDRLFVYKFLCHSNVIATTSAIGYLYGSFSSTSLKHAKLSLDELYTRQELLSIAGHNLLNRFGIEGKRSYCISANLLTLLSAAAESIVLQGGRCGTRIDILSQFILDNFTNESLLFFKEDYRFCAAVEGNCYYKLLLSKDYKTYICKLWLRQSMLRVKQLINKIIGRQSYRKNFDSYINRLN